MATLKTVVRRARADGFYPVYIRVTHRRESSFIKTDKMVTKKELTKNNEIKDPFVMQYCMQKILQFTDKLNKTNIENWTVKEIVSYLNESDDICFSEYAREQIAKMIDKGNERNAKNYANALKHLENFTGSQKIMFRNLTSQLMIKWIDTLHSTHRAKEMYPICMRQIFKKAMLDYNDYDNGIIRIKTNPWVKVEIPSADVPTKRAITPEACRDFFSFPMPKSKQIFPLTEISRDVAMLVLCLAGINSVDLYFLRKKDYYNGIIHYERAKTRKSRNDNAYMEMRVPAIVKPIFEKYLNRNDDDDRLFNFYQRMTTSQSFCSNINLGLRNLCEAMDIPKEERYSVYTFRHTWATVAQNNVRASISDVAFALNHSSGNKVTRGYIKIDYSPAWEMNEKVIDFIFFSGGKKDKEIKDDHFEISENNMVNAVAYRKGENVAELTDVGFSNADEVINKLITLLPDDYDYRKSRSIVLIKIVNLDKRQTAVYQRTI